MILVLLLCTLPLVGSVRYVDWYEGSADTNVVMTVPHDGWIKLDAVPDRLQGCYDRDTEECDWHHDCPGERVDRKCFAVTWADLHASVIAKVMRNEIAAITGKTPHLIVSRLHRSKMDPNRFRDNAAQYNDIAGQAYDMFHGLIERVHNILTLRGPAIHFDIHGYTTHNPDNWTELGYNIQRWDLNDGNLDPDGSSIRALAARSEASFESLLNGEESLGKLMQEEGFRVVPSPQYPTPDTGTEGKYFRGGYITRKWGSLNGGQIDCVQIEFPQWIRNDSDLYGPKFGRAMAKWIENHYPN